MNTSADLYFTDGCGRCEKGGTPQCKVNNWKEELKQLRRIVLECGLTEESKWGVPCYTFQKKNILIVSAFKTNCTLSFFKGSLLSDADGILVAPGENSQSTRMVRFSNAKQIIEKEPILKAYIFEAIEVEKAGLKVDLKDTAEYEVPVEFQKKLDEIPALRSAFDALTPGRKRAYLLYFAQAKQSKTREARIEKYLLHIMDGKGLTD